MNKEIHNKIIHVERLTIRPTLQCNLRCKFCNEYSPYYLSPKVPVFEEMRQDIKRVFELIDSVGILEISGGEPLLYKPLSQILEFIREYNERFEFFSLVTNGTLKISSAVLEELRLIGSKVRVIVDDYGELSRQAHYNSDVLKEAGVRYELRDQFKNIHADGWVDFTDFSLKNTPEQATAIFSQCVCPQKLHWVVTLHSGYLYPCHFMRRCIELGIVPENPVECIDIHDAALSDAELRDNIAGLYGLRMLSACRYCAGFIEGRERKKPAEQLPVS
jgi:organic radical activating enzyme